MRRSLPTIISGLQNLSQFARFCISRIIAPSSSSSSSSFLFLAHPPPFLLPSCVTVAAVLAVGAIINFRREKRRVKRVGLRAYLNKHFSLYETDVVGTAACGPRKARGPLVFSLCLAHSPTRGAGTGHRRRSLSLPASCARCSLARSCSSHAVVNQSHAMWENSRKRSPVSPCPRDILHRAINNLWRIRVSYFRTYRVASMCSP